MNDDWQEKAGLLSPEEQRERLRDLLSGSAEWQAVMIVSIPGDVTALVPFAPRLRGYEIVSPQPGDPSFDIWKRSTKSGKFWDMHLVRSGLTKAQVGEWLAARTPDKDVFTKNATKWAEATLAFYSVPKREADERTAIAQERKEQSLEDDLQVDRLKALIRATARVHKVNLAIMELDPGVYGLRGHGYAENTVVTLGEKSGYSFWVDGELIEPQNLPLPEAASLLAQRYMDAKAIFVITQTWGMPLEVAHRVLNDPVERERFFQVADKPSMGKPGTWILPEEGV